MHETHGWSPWQRRQPFDRPSIDMYSYVGDSNDSMMITLSKFYGSHCRCTKGNDHDILGGALLSIQALWEKQNDPTRDERGRRERRGGEGGGGEKGGLRSMLI